MKLPGLSVKNPVTTLMIFIGVLIVGLMCLSLLPIDLLPEMDLPAITVITPYEGAAPQDVETKVTEVLERYLSTVPELKHITSTSKEDMSIITLAFEWGTDLETRANEVRDAVGLSKIELADEVDEPRVVKFDVSRFPIMVYGVLAKESYPKLEDILEDDIADPLKRLPGVAAASIRLTLHRQINVDLDRERLAAYGLTPQDVVHSVTNENKDTPAGNIKTGLTDYLIRVPGEFKEVRSMQQIVLTSYNGSIVKLSDVGTVTDGFKEIEQYIRINGKPGAILLIQKESGGNTAQVARAVRKRLEQLKKRLPADVKVINLMDSSEDVERTIHDLSQTLMIGGLLAMLIVLIFLRQWRATIVIGLTIPFSLVITLIVIYFFDYTINMMTLFGMTIGIGLVVDNAIVILENITRHRRLGERPKEGAVYGASEVAMAITASTLTTVCIFFPILFVQGIIKIFFTEFAIVVSVILLASLFSALTLTPMLSSTLMRKDSADYRKGAIFNKTESMFSSLSEKYTQLLDWSLNHRKVVIVSATSIFFASLLLLPSLGSEFMPKEDKAVIQGTVRLPAGTRVEETARVMEVLEGIVKEEVAADERLSTYARCGISSTKMMSVFGDEAPHIGVFGVKLVPKTQRSRIAEDIAAGLRKRIDRSKALLRIDRYSLNTGDPLEGMLLGGEKPLTVNIIGDDMDLTDQIADRIKKITQNTPGTVDVSISRVRGRPELWVDVDRDKASSMGLNVSDIGDTIRALFYGRKATKYRIKGDEYDIFVRLQDKYRQDIRNVAATPLRVPTGKLVRTDNVAETNIEFGPVEIIRKDQGRIVNVEGDVYQRSLGEVVSDIEAEIEKMKIPQGVEIQFAGQTEEQRESFFWLTVALIVGAALVYMVMASQFESLLHPFIVMFSIPFAYTGTIWFIFLGGHNMSVIVFIGLLMLTGIVVNNAIVLVDYINILRARGLPITQAIKQAGQTRLRPVLMTALTTIFALSPMAFTKGQSSEIWNPLGLTVMGGLIVSTLVTLVLIPTMYSLLEARTRT
ncbi:MAG: efflux RND transporter permease subunit [Sedimentisphaerales bacterium]|nr:efflux RND transporter permease subunit [Sedimentisphaerales bacterium]